MRAFNINLRRYKVRFRRMGLAVRIRTRRVSGFSDAIGGSEIARIDHRFDFFWGEQQLPNSQNVKDGL